MYWPKSTVVLVNLSKLHTFAIHSMYFYFHNFTRKQTNKYITGEIQYFNIIETCLSSLNDILLKYIQCIFSSYCYTSSTLHHQREGHWGCCSCGWMVPKTVMRFGSQTQSSSRPLFTIPQLGGTQAVS